MESKNGAWLMAWENASTNGPDVVGHAITRTLPCFHKRGFTTQKEEKNP